MDLPELVPPENAAQVDPGVAENNNPLGEPPAIDYREPIAQLDEGLVVPNNNQNPIAPAGPGNAQDAGELAALGGAQGVAGPAAPGVAQNAGGPVAPGAAQNAGGLAAPGVAQIAGGPAAQNAGGLAAPGAAHNAVAWNQQGGAIYPGYAANGLLGAHPAIPAWGMHAGGFPPGYIGGPVPALNMYPALQPGYYGALPDGLIAAQNMYNGAIQPGYGVGQLLFPNWGQHIGGFPPGGPVFPQYAGPAFHPAYGAVPHGVNPASPAGSMYPPAAQPVDARGGQPPIVAPGRALGGQPPFAAPAGARGEQPRGIGQRDPQNNYRGVRSGAVVRTRRRQRTTAGFLVAVAEETQERTRRARDNQVPAENNGEQNANGNNNN